MRSYDLATKESLYLLQKPLEILVITIGGILLSAITLAAVALAMTAKSKTKRYRVNRKNLKVLK